MYKYIISLEYDYDEYSILQHFPIYTKYTKKEIEQEFYRIFKIKNWDSDKFRDNFSNYCGSKQIPILDTNILLQHEYQLYDNDKNIFKLPEILLLEEWFEKYAK